jgi:hypothetical protein
MRKCIVILLLCSVGMHGESLASRSKKLLLASFAAVTTAEVADSASSWGKLESNPVLGQSRFGIGKATVKLGVVTAILTGQYLLLRSHSPKAYKAVAAFNFASAGVLGGIAYRNSKIAPWPQ